LSYDISDLATPTHILIEYLASHPPDIYAIAPRKMEQIVEAIYRDHLNCKVELTATTRDGGKDLICLDSDAQKFVVEVKRYGRTNRIGIGIIQRFAGVLLSEGVSKGVIVTTSDFTREARRCAERIVSNSDETLRLELKAEQDFLAWLRALNLEYSRQRGTESSSFVGLQLPPFCELPGSLRSAVMGEEPLSNN
jgi:hypothetical protein